MASSSQQTRRLSSIPRLPAASLPAGSRWGAAVASSAPDANRGWKEVSNRRRRGRRTTVWVDDCLPVAAPSKGAPSKVAPNKVAASAPRRVQPALGQVASPQVASPSVASPSVASPSGPRPDRLQPDVPRPGVLQLNTAPSVSVALGECPAVGSFAQNRVRHAFELFGACMMIAAFLAMAMFA